MSCKKVIVVIELLGHIACTQCIDAEYCYRYTLVCVSVGHNHEWC